MTQHRRRIKPTANLEMRLTVEAKRLRKEAEEVGPGAARDEALKKVRRCEKWLRLPDSQLSD